MRCLCGLDSKNQSDLYCNPGFFKSIQKISVGSSCSI
ncbi:MAG: hypothetical protein ACI85I_001526, partial [Arenicella sp.]